MRALAGLAAAAALLLAGCVAPAADLEAGSAAAEALRELVAGAPVRVSASQPAREPSIALAADGTLFVAGYWGATRFAERGPGDADNVLLSPLVWRSRDDGATWERLATGNVADGAVGNSDVSLAIGPDGRVWIASLHFVPVVAPVGLVVPGAPYGATASAVYVGWSDDGGDSWTWTLARRGPYVDRPWIRIGEDGLAHLVWNDHEGVYHATSTDGAQWTPARRVAEGGGTGGFDVSDAGELAVRVVPLRGSGLYPMGDADGVAVSADRGETWTMRALPGERVWDAGTLSATVAIPRAWDPVAFDASGRLCAAWAEPGSMQLACSEDLAATWSTPRAIADDAHGQPFFPFLRRADDGLAASWFADADGVISAHAARLRGDEVASVVLAGDTGSDDHGEYFEIVATPDGGLAAAVPVLDGMQALDFVEASEGGAAPGQPAR